MNFRRKLGIVIPVVVMVALLIALVAIPAGAVPKVPTLLSGGGVLNSPAIPAIINYQGYLTDSEGTPTGGVLTMTFSIYDSETGGTPIWTEVQDVVFNDGLFNVMLGETTMLSPSFFEGSPRYLGISIAGEELTPRQQLASVPYAFQAENAETIDGMDSADFVAVAGDTMTGQLVLPANGLVAGTNQLVLTGGKVGIGTNTPVGYKLYVEGGSDSGIYASGNTHGVYGKHSGSGNYGRLGTSGTGVSGENQNTGNYGHLGTNNEGAYGEHFNSGNYGELGASGYGVYGEHWSSGNYGELGTSDYGVYGWSGNCGVNGYGGNYGVYGTHFNGNYGQLGTSDYGVYGINSGSGNYGQLGTSNYGVYGEHHIGCHGILGSQDYGVYGHGITYGVYGESDSGAGVGGSSLNSYGVIGYGAFGSYDFYAAGAGADYGPFTGAHEVKLSVDFSEDIRPGLIVSVTGETQVRTDEGEITYSSTLPTVILSETPNDKKVFGVIISETPLPEDHWYQAIDGERFGIVNALGEGRVWVSNINGDIEAGDYITTSAIAGFGQKQDDDLLHSYTLGKAIETIDWSQVTETIEFNGKTYKVYAIAVVYTSG